MKRTPIREEDLKMMTLAQLKNLYHRLHRNLAKYDDTAMGMRRTPRRMAIAGDIDRVVAEWRTRI